MTTSNEVSDRNPRAPGGLRRPHTRALLPRHFSGPACRSITAPSIWRNAAVTRAIRVLPRAAAGLLLAGILLLTVATPAPAQRPEPRPKNINGVVRDLRGQPILGARVFVLNTETDIIRTLTTDADGLYTLSGLAPDVDYEVYAEFQGKGSRRRIVSSFLNRPDNVLNFELDVAIVPTDADLEDDGGPRFDTFDLVQIRGSFELPTGIPAPIPAVLLLHGYGENRAVWGDLESRLLTDGWAVMSIDLRGHGLSKTRNREPIEPEPDWRMDSRQFPLDVGPALDWMKSQPRLASNRIVVMGTDVGANLALIAGGRFGEVYTVVAIDPDMGEALSMSGSAQDFTPRSALLMVNDQAVGTGIRNYISGPSRIVTLPVDGGTAAWLADPRSIDEIVRWLRDVY